MTAHPELTERQREVVAAVIVTGSIKGAASVIGISPTSANHRILAALERCGCCISDRQLIFYHRAEIVDRANIAPTGLARTG